MPGTAPKSTFAALLLLGACGSPTGESKGPPELVTTLPRALSVAESKMSAATNALGWSLLREARKAEAGKNLFISPLSVSLALGMTLNGAAGTTLDSMRIALGVAGEPIEEINAGYRNLIDLLHSLDATSQFEIANSIWADAGTAFLPAFLATGKTSFDAEVRALDFAAPATLATINDWVNAKTHGKIPKILDAISPEEVMFLINAIYFKGNWRSAFDPDRTLDAPFHASDGTIQSVKMMSLDPEIHPYSSNRDLELVELPYGNGTFVMDIVLPREDRTLAAVTEGLDATRWAELVSGLHDRDFGLRMPRFKMEYKRTLNEDLKALGMRVAFDSELADFTNLIDDKAWITKVQHKTFVDVNEEGTEAAAVTSVGIGVTSAPATLSIDRPFLFVIRERLTGTILFVGQLTQVP